MEQSLIQIQTLSQKDKANAYISLLNSILTSSSSNNNNNNNSTKTLLKDLLTYLDSILNESQIIARTSLTEFVNKLINLNLIKVGGAGGEGEGEGQENIKELKKELFKSSLNKIQPKVNSFEEQIINLRLNYSDLLEEDEEFIESAKNLILIPLESTSGGSGGGAGTGGTGGTGGGGGNSTNEFKLNIYIRVVRCFLEEEDSTSAETYFNRATLLIHTIKDQTILLQFKLSQARMFDFSRKFLEASSKYLELSYFVNIPEEERIFCLSSAITCAVLAPAGPNRSRVLSSLYRDERSLQTPHHTILSKMFLDQVIRPAEVSEFASTLKPHQLALLPSTQSIIIAEDAEDEVGKKGPENVLDKAIMYHNVLGASRIYSNITFKGLGLLLGLRPSAAEAMARTMIQQQRLKGSIDQMESLIIFDSDSKEGVDGVVSNVAAAAAGLDVDEEKEEVGSAPATKRWDSQIRNTLQLVESIAMRCQILLAGSGVTEVGETMARMEDVQEEISNEKIENGSGLKEVTMDEVA